MIRARVEHQGPIENTPLQFGEAEVPEPGPGQIQVEIQFCGVCHTDLHTAEGDIVPPELPITPGHQIVGKVTGIGEGAAQWNPGDIVGVPWLYSACGACDYCRRGLENLCPDAAFTGFHVDGGYAETMLADSDYALRIPVELDPETAAPLLCAGIVGYRSLRLAEVERGARLGLVGFGASAHLAIQVALHWGCEVFVFTRSEGHRRLADELGATWVGSLEASVRPVLDSAIIFAPAGDLVPQTLAWLRPGGTLAINAIHMTPIPEMEYERIYGERTMRTVTNATRQDGEEFLSLAAAIPVRPRIIQYPLAAANSALLDLKHSAIDGAAVLTP